MRLVAAVFIAVLVSATPAFAHSAARGFVLLLPTTYVILGGAFAVLATFSAISLLPDNVFRTVAHAEKRSQLPTSRISSIVSLFSLAMLIALVVIGFAGPEDPLENLLPLSVWTLWWVCLVLLHPLFGNLWKALNPFTGIHAAVGGRQVLKLPDRFRYAPAVVIFAAFAWFQLIYPAPEDPLRLAVAVSIYAVFTMLAVFLFGARAWMEEGDPFGIFLSQLGATAPVDLDPHVRLRFPGAGLLTRPALPIMGTLFVLLTLSAISFDGFANTFLWVSAIGFNPLEYPGRTALMTFNTLGLASSFIVLAAIYMACIAIGWEWAGRPGSLAANMGRFVFSLIPISITYHFAHYVSDTLVNLQYFALALNDPLGNGANLLGLGDFHVTASFQNTAPGAVAIFTTQTCAIISGHIVGVAIAHLIAVQQGLPKRSAWKLEVPLAVFMVAFTAFGLWLLSTPSVS